MWQKKVDLVQSYHCITLFLNTAVCPVTTAIASIRDFVNFDIAHQAWCTELCDVEIYKITYAINGGSYTGQTALLRRKVMRWCDSTRTDRWQEHVRQKDTSPVAVRCEIVRCG